MQGIIHVKGIASDMKATGHIHIFTCPQVSMQGIIHVKGIASDMKATGHIYTSARIAQATSMNKCRSARAIHMICMRNKNYTC